MSQVHLALRRNRNICIVFSAPAVRFSVSLTENWYPQNWHGTWIDLQRSINGTNNFISWNQFEEKCVFYKSSKLIFCWCLLVWELYVYENCCEIHVILNRYWALYIAFFKVGKDMQTGLFQIHALINIVLLFQMRKMW